MNESDVEQAAVLWFWEMGYKTLYGPDIAPGEPKAERRDYGEVLLASRLQSALAKINPKIPKAILSETWLPAGQGRKGDFDSSKAGGTIW